MLYPVYELRPLPDFFRGEFLRYADGAWIPDDGETYDLAFGGQNKRGFPVCLYFEPGYQKNIIWSWLPGDWRADNSDHPRGNPWHYMLRPGETEWGGDWGRDRHPNDKAGRAGMSKVCGMHGCANGRSIEFKLNDEHIAAGLLRERDTKTIVRLPTEFVCMYCGDGWQKHPAAEAMQAKMAANHANEHGDGK